MGHKGYETLTELRQLSKKAQAKEQNSHLPALIALSASEKAQAKA